MAPNNNSGPPLILNETNYSAWSYLMRAKLDKIGAYGVVSGTKKIPKDDKPDEKESFMELDRLAYIELVQHLDTNHNTYVSQSLSEEESSSGYSIWQLLKKRYAGDDYISRDLAFEKFLELEFGDSTATFISEAREINHQLVSAKVGLDDQVKTSMLLRKLPSSFASFQDVLNVGCVGDTVSMMLNRLEKHAAQNHLDRVSSTLTQQAFLTTDEKIFLCPHCKRGFTICSHCEKAGHTEPNCFKKHPERRNAVKTGAASSSSSVSTKPKTTAQAHMVHGFTAQQVEEERNFQLMINNPEFKKLHPDIHL
ncbi:hypothetical protein Pst134EA_033559 [Puccinia striiformis f. sp. tritici]|uniref:uncharacterized protein n=1 Tax=Puccinia striiformis f. sp. tritici TaxID=168172 RepID=UPI002007456C|nr:uncharacterized protein Pst134EA_033559 [Puccinia striiformis f. sp. tritici]KAH9440655.1 hypothetical protein Pst134EA_033559 [Puccinia striiformis f. sp. tritici]KAH9466961.1 hypothetical protein Pst134EB_033246 [Puccinia striiformis f. sp. tritici]